MRLSDGAVLVLVSEALQELSEDLVEANLTRDDLGVLRAVELLPNVKRCHVAVAIFVKLVEGLDDPGVARFVGLSTDLVEELVEVDGAIFISVENVEENLCLSLGDGYAVVLQAEVELLLVKLARAVIGGDHSEGSGHAAELSGSLGQNGFLNLSEDYIEDIEKPLSYYRGEMKVLGWCSFLELFI